MKKIKVLGSSCSKCEKLMANAETAAKALGIEYRIEKVTKVNEISDFGVMMTPAFAVDDDVKSIGKVLSVEEIKKYLS